MFTWHYDIRKTQLPGNRYTSVEDHGVFPSNLLHVTTKKLKRYNKSWKKTKKLIFSDLRIRCLYRQGMLVK